MKKSIVPLSIISGILLQSLTLATFAQESYSDGNIAIKATNHLELIQRIAKQDPAQFSINTISTKQDGKFASEQKEYNIRMDIDQSKNIVVFEKNKLSMRIGLPKNQNLPKMQNIQGQITSENDNFDVVIQSIDGGMRYILNIHSNKADKYYDFPMELPSGYFFNQDSSGVVLIKDASGKIYTSIGRPWAKDANGNEIKTWYTIKDSTLRQYVDFDKNTVFPIVADPIWCGQTIQSTSWINRGGAHPWSLSVIPTECGAWGVTPYSRESYWQDLLSKTPSSIYWSQVSISQNGSMLDQLMCHAYFPGGTKTPWNLEPTRPNVGYWATVNALCNPN